MKKVLIVGAGLSGSVLARQLAESGVESLVIDRSDFIGGLCHSRRDEETGVDMHYFGPHIFNTSSERARQFAERFDSFVPWVNRVKACNHRGIFSFPINLHTINQLFGVQLSPRQARDLIEEKRDHSIVNPQNTEEKLLSMVGKEIYETFFKGYTIKQWGVSPRELPADILKRIPVRFNYDDNYYKSTYQALPRSGYTAWITNMLNHPRITVGLGVTYEQEMNEKYEHVFYAGPIDEYFHYSEGDLSYRTVTFEIIRGDFEQQGCACMNFSDLSVPWTRSHEHNYFSPWETHEKSVLMREYSAECTREMNKIYPKRMQKDLATLQRYIALAQQQHHVSFIGRLGCYRYLDMQQCILMMLDYADKWVAWKNGRLATLPCMPIEV